MAVSQSLIRNRLLAALTREDYVALAPRLEDVTLDFQAMVIEAYQPIRHVYFPESGIVSSMANTAEGRIEIGVVGREGMVGLAVVLGSDSTPHSFMVQGQGKALRIAADDLRAAIRDRPSTFRPFGLYAQALMVQIGQTAYANASFTVEARLARWILMMQDRLESDEMQLTHSFLSVMLGVRRPGVTTATHILEGMGAIRARRGRIEVRDREKLLDLADDSYRVAEEEYERLFGV